jgi:hypothetical protein
MIPHSRKTPGAFWLVTGALALAASCCGMTSTVTRTVTQTQPPVTIVATPTPAPITDCTADIHCYAVTEPASVSVSGAISAITTQQQTQNITCRANCTSHFINNEMWMSASLDHQIRQGNGWIEAGYGFFDETIHDEQTGQDVPYTEVHYFWVDQRPGGCLSDKGDLYIIHPLPKVGIGDKVTYTIAQQPSDQDTYDIKVIVTGSTTNASTTYANTPDMASTHNCIVANHFFIGQELYGNSSDLCAPDTDIFQNPSWTDASGQHLFNNTVQSNVLFSEPIMNGQWSPGGSFEVTKNCQ